MFEDNVPFTKHIILTWPKPRSFKVQFEQRKFTLQYETDCVASEIGIKIGPNISFCVHSMAGSNRIRLFVWTGYRSRITSPATDVASLSIGPRLTALVDDMERQARARASAAETGEAPADGDSHSLESLD